MLTTEIPLLFLLLIACLAAIATFLQTENFYHFFAFILCMAVVFLSHNIFKELDAYLGKGKLHQLFFWRPRLIEELNSKSKS